MACSQLTNADGILTSHSYQHRADICNVNKVNKCIKKLEPKATGEEGCLTSIEMDTCSIPVSGRRVGVPFFSPSRGTLGSNTPLSYGRHPARELALPRPDADNSLPGPRIPSLNLFLTRLPDACWVIHSSDQPSLFPIAWLIQRLKTRASGP